MIEFLTKRLENGNYYVLVFKDEVLTVERTYLSLDRVTAVMKEIFEPKPEKRLFHKSGKDDGR